MAYRVTSRFTKDDSKPWPWDRQDLAWLTQAVDLFSRAKSVGENALTHQETLVWLKSVSVPGEICIEKEFETQEQANRYVLALYDIVTDYSLDFEAWGADCGYENIQHHLGIQEI
jgi:hypothetical protein